MATICRLVSTGLILLFLPSLALGQRPAALSDWTNVLTIEPGTEIVLKTDDGGPGKVRLLSIGPRGLTWLRLDDPAISPDVATALRRSAALHPACFTDGRSHKLTAAVRIDDGAVYRTSRGTTRLFDLERVIAVTPRSDVVELSVVSFGRHMERHTSRGSLIGGVAAGLLGGVVTKGSTEDRTAIALAGFLVGSLVGLQVGAVVGLAAPINPTLLYRREQPQPEAHEVFRADTLVTSWLKRAR
ncbi:MAG: hypothetical protein IT184_13985 [Acidobacteria bacterium]|nr:hypothetical protein [Acidobacteriota bacterium]